MLTQGRWPSEGGGRGGVMLPQPRRARHCWCPWEAGGGREEAWNSPLLSAKKEPTPGHLDFRLQPLELCENEEVSFEVIKFVVACAAAQQGTQPTSLMRKRKLTEATAEPGAAGEQPGQGWSFAPQPLLLASVSAWLPRLVVMCAQEAQHRSLCGRGGGCSCVRAEGGQGGPVARESPRRHQAPNGQGPALAASRGVHLASEPWLKPAHVFR